jgi:hypothetical protein
MKSSARNASTAGLQQRFFGSSSEKLDPNQLQFDIDELALGKPASAAAPDDPDDPEAKTRAATTRRTKAERFPKNLKIVIEQVIIPNVVGANPDAYEEIGEEHHDELEGVNPEMFWRLAAQDHQEVRPQGGQKPAARHRARPALQRPRHARLAGPRRDDHR